MNQNQDSRTLSDYLTALRRRRGVIVSLIVIAAGLAVGLSLTEEETFVGEASIRVKDPSEVSAVGGIQPTQGDLPAQVAAQAAITSTEQDVLRAVKSKLGLGESVAQIQSRIEARQDPESNFVDIIAEAPSAIEASRLANALADEASKAANAEAQGQYRQLADELRAQADSADTPQEQAVLVTQAARLQTLSTVAKLSEVATRATPPGSPDSPKPLRNGILAGFLGLLLGLIAAGILESLDRRLRDPDEVQDELGIPLAGVVSDHALGGVPISGVPGEEHVAAMDMFRMLRTNVAYLNVDSPAKTVLVTSSLPDEGKTTVAIGLALASALTGRRTLLVETDLHRPVHSERLGIRAEPGLTDLLAGEADPKEVLQGLRFTDPGALESDNGAEVPKATLSCITAGTRAGRAAELLGSRRFADFISEVSEHYDLIVLDTAPVLAVAETLEVAPIADTILFCVRLGRTTLDEAKKGADALARLPERSTGLVITDLGATDTSGYSYYSYSYSYRFGKDPEKSKPLASK